MDLVTFVQAIVLGLVQGATEFLPISSSGHLVLVPWLLDWPDLGLAFDAVVHWGTLVAVVLYFRQDLEALARGWLASVRERRLDPNPTSPSQAGEPRGVEAGDRRLAWLILIGTLPAVAAGLLFEDLFAQLFARPDWAARFLVVTGLLLVGAERVRGRRLVTAQLARPGSVSGPYPSSRSGGEVPQRVETSVRERDQELRCGAQAEGTGHDGLAELHRSNSEPSSGVSLRELTLTGVLLIGVAQALAIAPGISRSGATIAAGLLVGLGRHDAARFSFLLATPVILGAGLLQLVRLFEAGGLAAQVPLLAVGFLVAAVTGYLAIRFLLDYLQRHTLYVFAVYCWIVGLGSLLLVQ